MTAINLEWTKTTSPDFSGWCFYVESGRMFDADDFASAYNLNRYDINPDHIHSVQDAASKLGAGEWLLVEFSRVRESDMSEFDEVEAAIAAARREIPDGSRTARAIDRHDSWEDIATFARAEGFVELSDMLDEASEGWQS